MAGRPNNPGGRRQYGDNDRDRRYDRSYQDDRSYQNDRTYRDDRPYRDERSYPYPDDSIPQNEYGRMYNERLDKYREKSGDTAPSDGGDLRFYTAEELDAIDRAKEDAARQAYEDAYREEYDRIMNDPGSNAGNYRPKQSAPSRPRAEQHRREPSYSDKRRRVKPASQVYANAASRKHESERIEFGSRNSAARRSGSAVGIVLKAIFTIIVVIVLLFQVLIFRYISMVETVPTGNRLVTTAEMSDTSVTNILLIGCDSRRDDDAGRTDTMILLSINSSSKEVTLTSLMRDCYVEIPGRGWDKLNAAYTYGGTDLLMDTVAQNFGVRVDRYVFVSFFSFIKIVDAAGGLDLDMSDEEALGMTDPMAEQNKYLKNEKGTDYLTAGGSPLHVNGNQALAYARLRYVGNADFERTDRQRIVINKLVEKAKTLSLSELDSFLKISCRELTTNMSKGEMYLMFYQLLFAARYERSELRIPPEGAYYYGTHDGQSTLDLDLDACKKAIKDKVYK